MKRIATAAVVIPALSALLLTGAGPAQSAADTTPPTLRAPVKSSFTVGQQIPVGYVPDCGGGEAFDLRIGVAQNFTWSGADDSGSVRYDLAQTTGRDGTEDVFTDSTQRSYAGRGENTNQDCGGGNGTVYEWTLTAEDAAGNQTTRNIYGGRIRLTQDNNLADLANYATVPQISYGGRWQLASCACWSQGGVHKTTAKGATATLRIPLPFEQFPPGPNTSYTHVGLVMHTGPDRGKFKVYVDGVLKGTVDTYAATNRPRVLVWQAAVGGVGAGSPTITVVNQATPGRARIDLDAVLTN